MEVPDGFSQGMARESSRDRGARGRCLRRISLLCGYCSAVTAYLLERVNKAEKIEATNKYNTQISDLTTRLSSIERRAGPNQEKRYFDVQSMQVSLAEVRNLPAQFKNFDNGAFFLNAPISQTWNYAVLSEGEVAKS
jgi:hypothetical protein